ncbi:hypothetical protein [Methanolobus bombayensis]|uniref:hypothetical protein n=1 Tax=Methanolobus bombayensis TaxID=38023 RepID=UPI001AE92918|nr:hypothetical protein [Methanolobus bombayensis]MBP1910471.1 hypothetical protein [Methanolobus bombayensis]
MSIVDDVLEELSFKPNEIELYRRIRFEVFLKNSDGDKNSIVSRISKMIDEEYSE